MEEKAAKRIKNRDDSTTRFCIPNDLFVDILSLLPLMCIIRCKLVCKAWERLITHQHSFLMARAPNLPLTHLICRRNDRRPAQEWHPKSEFTRQVDYSTISVHDYINKDDKNMVIKASHEFHTSIPLNMYYLPWKGRRRSLFAIIDACNGLILCCIRPTSLFVVNPSNETWLLLPTLPHSVKKLLSFLSVSDSCGIVLSFDPKISTHFTVLCPIFMEDNPVRLVTFSSRSGAWNTSILQMPGLNKRRENYLSLVLLDGCMYWRLEAKDCNNILRLDLGREVFDLIDPPPCEKPYNLKHIAKGKGRLQFCEICYHFKGLHFWELEDWSTSKWTLKHKLTVQFLTASLGYDHKYFPITYQIKVFFDPIKDAIYMRLGNSTVFYYEFDTKKTLAIELKSFDWHGRLLPLSKCGINLFQMKKTWKNIATVNND